MLIEEVDEKLILINQLKSAYRKYKTQIYYDTHSAIQRKQLADFERREFCELSNEDNSYFDAIKIDKFFENLAEKVIYNELKDYREDIKIIALPKKMKSNASEIISNYNDASTNIEQIHYFIELPVEAHILGALWILRCGFILDDRLYKNCYGNRLNKHLLNDLKEKEIWKNWEYSNKFSPFLFEPYYKNYQSWRDNALDSVKNLLKNDKHAIMISLDFKNYYYNCQINFDLMKEDIKKGEELIHKHYPSEEKIDINSYHTINNNLTDFIKKIFDNYHEKFKHESKLPFIPLGFLPSMIIANWNLQGFDQAILEDVHPSYYGRYVDDILIVLDSHEKSKTYGEHHLKGKDANEIIEKYLTTYDSEHPLNHIFYFDKDNPIKNKDKDKDKIQHPIKVHNIKHRVHGIEFNYENLQVQPNKVKLYSFSHKFSTAIIDNFKKEIAKNSSEFKLMKDSDKLFSGFEEKLFEIDYAESINKLNNINSVKISKFEISKLLTGVLNSSVFSTEKIKKTTIDKVIEAFESNIFEFFTLWEKLFSILYINGNEEELLSFIEFILKNIETLTFTPEDEINYLIKKEISKDIEIVRKSLRRYLGSTLIRVLSLKSSEVHQKIPILKNQDENNVNFYLKHSFNFIFSSMLNNSLMKYPLQNTFKIQKLIKTNWGAQNTYEDIKYNLIKENASDASNTIFNGFCYPRYIKLHEIVLNEIYNTIYIKNNKNDFIDNFDEKIKLHSKLNFYNPYDNNKIRSSIYPHVKSNCGLKCHKCDECPIDDNFKSMKVGSKNKRKLKVGLINTKLNMQDFEKRLIGNPNLTLKRFNRIKLLINDAIKNKVDLLLMPEMYVPFEWIGEIINASKVHQMCMIFGVEPIVIESKVHNYIMTSLPFSIDDSYFEAVVSCRLKNHYSPEEVQCIESQHLEKPNENMKYYLYSWNGIHISPFYCYEIADIQSRSKFKSCCDIVTVSEFNKDAIYFKNIAESLSRDIYCYCMKSNTSEYGGNSIIQPAKSEIKKIVELKGGENDYLVIQELDIQKLRDNAIKSDSIPNKKDKNLKPNPPGLNVDIIKERMKINNKYSQNPENHYDSIPPERVEKEALKMISNEFNDELIGKTIGIWGLSLKPGTRNVESSPAIKIVNELYELNVNIKVYDPENNTNFNNKIKNLSIEYKNSKYSVLNNSDALLILTGWEEFKHYDLNEMSKRMKQKIIFDCRGVINEDMINNEFKYKRINLNEKLD